MLFQFKLIVGNVCEINQDGKCLSMSNVYNRLKYYRSNIHIIYISTKVQIHNSRQRTKTVMHTFDILCGC